MMGLHELHEAIKRENKYRHFDEEVDMRELTKFGALHEDARAKYRFNDRVVVADWGAQYTTFQEMADKLGAEYYVYDPDDREKIPHGAVGTIIGSSSHSVMNDGRIVYGIRYHTGSRLIDVIVGERGISRVGYADVVDRELFVI